MKGAEVDDELKTASKAIEILGGKLKNKDIFTLPQSDLGRSIIVLEKIKSTPGKFPRKPGTPAKEPIV